MSWFNVCMGEQEKYYRYATGMPLAIMKWASDKIFRC